MMLSTKSAACGIPLKQLGLIVPPAILAFLSSWGSVADAVSWEIVIVTSIVIALAVHQHQGSKRTRNLKVASKVHWGDSGDNSCSAARISAKRHASEVEDRRKRLIRVFRDILKVDASAYANPSDVFYKNQVDVTKLHTWMQEIETHPHPADKDEALLFSVMWHHVVRRGDVFSLERVLDCIVNCGVHATISMYTQVISGLGKRGKVQEAEKWFIRMKEAGMEGDAQLYSSIIHGWAQAGRPDLAAKWYDRMLTIDLVPTEVTFNSLINACAKGGAPEEGEKWMNAMEAAGIPPSVCTFNALINAFTRAGETERAEYWLMEIVRRGMEPDIVSFSTIVHSLSFQKLPTRVMQADRLLRRMIAFGLSDSRQMAYNYRCVILVCAKGKELDLAKYWLKAAEEAGINAGKYSYKFVANALEMAGRNEEANAMRERMENGGYGPAHARGKRACKDR